MLVELVMQDFKRAIGGKQIPCGVQKVVANYYLAAQGRLLRQHPTQLRTIEKLLDVVVSPEQLYRSSAVSGGGSGGDGGDSSRGGRSAGRRGRRGGRQ